MQYYNNNQIGQGGVQQQSIQIGFQGSIGNHHVSPRELLSGLLCHLVCVEGIVTKCSLVQPKVVKSVHFCEATDKFLTREYRDATALDLGIDAGGRARNETSSTYPTVDEHGNPLDTEFGLCTYKDHQSLVIQEMPERAPDAVELQRCDSRATGSDRWDCKNLILS